MEIGAAAVTLSALAHEGRLAIFRLLVEAGPDGMAAGDIARRLGVLPNSLSTNLSILSHAQLVGSERRGRSIIYTAAYDRMTAVLAFLTQDCCGGRLKVCGPLNDIIKRAACCPA